MDRALVSRNRCADLSFRAAARRTALRRRAGGRTATSRRGFFCGSSACLYSVVATAASAVVATALVHTKLCGSAAFLPAEEGLFGGSIVWKSGYFWLPFRFLPVSVAAGARREASS